MILAEKFQKHINACISAFGINPSFSYGIPSFTKKQA